ncbi:alcohol dehydrogenase catalytic domain-containing protein, partial [Fructobacillus ficulneus]
MKQAMFMKAGLVEVEDGQQPTLQKDDDVIIRVLKASVCGSDLWAYRGSDDRPDHSQNTGHEAIGVVTETGSAITTLKAGDFVIAPFTHGCGHCAACLAGFDGSCQSHRDNYTEGDQAEYIRFQHGNWALVKVPGKPEDYTPVMLNSFLTLADVMPT